MHWLNLLAKYLNCIMKTGFNAKYLAVILIPSPKLLLNISSCLSGASICEQCWPFMKIAMKIVDEALKGII